MTATLGKMLQLDPAYNFCSLLESGRQLYYTVWRYYISGYNQNASRCDCPGASRV